MSLVIHYADCSIRVYVYVHNICTMQQDCTFYLVGDGFRAKLSDFGLAQGVHEKNYYRVTGQTNMAPESLLYMEYLLQPQMCGKKFLSH